MNWLVYLPTALAAVVFFGSFGLLSWRRRVMARRAMAQISAERARLYPAAPSPAADTWEDDESVTIVRLPSEDTADVLARIRKLPP